MTRDDWGCLRHSCRASEEGILCSGGYGGPSPVERSLSGMVARCFPRSCLQGVFILEARSRDRSFSHRQVVPSPKRVVARVVGVTSFEIYHDYGSAEEIGDVTLLVGEGDIEVSCVFLWVFDRPRAPSVFTPGRRLSSWFD